MTPITLKHNDTEEIVSYWVKKYGDLLNTNRELQEENKSLRDAIVHMSQLMAGMVKERMEEDETP